MTRLATATGSSSSHSTDATSDDQAVGAAVQAVAERGHKGVKFAVDVDPQ